MLGFVEKRAESNGGPQVEWGALRPPARSLIRAESTSSAEDEPTRADARADGEDADRVCRHGLPSQGPARAPTHGSGRRAFRHSPRSRGDGGASEHAEGADSSAAESSESPAEMPKRPTALPKEHPVSMLRDLSRGMYMMLDEFVEANTGRPSPGFGFSVKDVPTLRTEPLVESCSKVIQVLTNMISLTATDALTVRAQDHAKDLKSMLQSYRLHMADKAFQGGVPEDAVPHLVEQTMMIQRMMSDHMNDLASLSMGISISRSSE